ncbi:MAG: tyrosine-type recombinase/integrase [Aliifodinibius sp.]|nr:tyrosine-type recombinase/integrase [Fodinibius sp.]NIV13018.1 tyrosine-type recombinase/integrase [Fodinibius sp.]NIY26683.1 tyrosine-type recombinase/integrase [Fodinibius sp.]
MSTNRKHIEFHSPVAPLIKQFIQEKQACGRKYNQAPTILKRFDNFLCSTTLKEKALPEKLVLQWLEKRPDEKASTQQRRIGLIRQFARMMVRLGYPAYIVPGRWGAPRTYTFSPYIFTREEISQLIQAADQIKPSSHSPLRHLIMPEIFRLYYGCGFRLDEVLNLRVGDVDLNQGVIIVREAKFGKDRLVPPALDLVARLRIYAERIEKALLEKRTADAFFFPSSSQTAWSSSGIYFLFRKLLYQCGIPHAGRGKGPRVHDLRHTFAVHRLIQWHEEGADLNAKLPLLVAYLGHQDFTGTQKYLHLTAELFPNLTERMNQQFGDVIPKGRPS